MEIIRKTTLIIIYNQNSNIINIDKFRYHGNHDKPDVRGENVKIVLDINSVHGVVVIALL
jgi:hypothetical protein